MPASLLNFLAKQQLSKTNKVQENFRRNGLKVDRERVDHLANVMKKRRGEAFLTRVQEEVFERCMTLFGDEGWSLIESPCIDLKMWMKYFPPKKGERSVATGKAVCTVDCSAEQIAAWIMDFCSNERMRTSIEEGQPARIELRNKRKVNEYVTATVKAMPLLLHNREFIARMIWKSEEGKVWIAMESMDEEVDYGVKMKTIRATTIGIYLMEDLLDRSGVSQTKVTMIQRIDVNGVVPTWLVSQKVPYALSVLQQAADYFRQDDLVEAEELRVLSNFLTEELKDEVYTAEENALVDRVSEKLDNLEEKEGTLTKVVSPDVFVKMDTTVVFDGGERKGCDLSNVMDATYFATRFACRS